MSSAVRSTDTGPERCHCCVIPVIRGLRFHLSSVTVTFNSNLVKACLASLDKWLTSFKDKKVYQRAAVLHPRFKLHWCTAPEATHVKADLVALLPRPTMTRDSTQLPLTKRHPLTKHECLFNFVDGNPKLIYVGTPPPMLQIELCTLDCMFLLFSFTI